MSKTNRKPLLAAALIAAGMMTAASAAEPKPEVKSLLDDAAYAWDFSGPEALAGDHGLKRVGACRLGKDGAGFSGGHLELEGGDTMPIGVEGDFSLAFRVQLDEKYFDLEKRYDATLFEWFGEDTADQPKRHSINLEIFRVGYLPDNGFLGVWVDDYCRATSLQSLQSGKWHSVVFRVKDGVGELFVDGSIPVYAPPRPLNQKMFGNDAPARIVDENSCLFGDNHRRDLPFEGGVGMAAVWNRALADGEVAALSNVVRIDTEWDAPADDRTRWAGHFPGQDLTLEQAYHRIYEDYVGFFRRALKEDVHFPRFHLTQPAFMTEPSMSSYKSEVGGYHIFPHDCVHWVYLFYRNNHYWQHFASEDLIHWRLMPLPQWPSVSAGNIIEQDGQAVSFPSQDLPRGESGSYEKWVSDDRDLKNWRLEKHIEIPPAPDAGGVIPKDPFTFRHEGQTWTIGSYAGWTRKNPETLTGRIDLYRHPDGDLDCWEHVGEFYRGTTTGVVHHPRLFFVDGKCVIDSDTPIDKDVWYLLGRIEDGQFSREGGGDFNFDCGGWSWGQTITEPDGRVLRWTMIRNLNTRNNLVTDNMRNGWGNVYTIPRVMRIRDSALRQAPAPEMAGLREENLFSAKNRALKQSGDLLPAIDADCGSIEVRCTLTVPESGKAGIVLSAGADNEVRFFYDQAAGELVLAFDKSRNGGKASAATGLGNNAKTKLAMKPGEELELTLYFDRSVIEAYANGEATAGRWYPDAPSEIRPGFFAEGADVELSQADVWRMGTIWKDYAGE